MDGEIYADMVSGNALYYKYSVRSDIE